MYHLLLTLKSWAFCLQSIGRVCVLVWSCAFCPSGVALFCFDVGAVFLCWMASALVAATWKQRVRGEFCATRDVTLKDLSVSGNWDLFLNRIYVIPGGQQVLCVDCIWQPCVLGAREWLT